VIILSSALRSEPGHKRYTTQRYDYAQSCSHPFSPPSAKRTRNQANSTAGILDMISREFTRFDVDIMAGGFFRLGGD